MNQNEKIVFKVKIFVRKKLKHKSSGHGYWHAYRVAQMAIFIGQKEKADLKVLELAGFLHDIGNDKDNDHEIKGAKISQGFLTKLKVNERIIKQVTYCVKNHRFSKGVIPKTLEAKIIQDADKLDALGAIEIVRVFSVSAAKKRKTYDPNVKPDFNYYLKHGVSRTAINHFYEKLFKLKNLMYTKTAKKIAINREKFMKAFLKRFFHSKFL